MVCGCGILTVGNWGILIEGVCPFAELKIVNMKRMRGARKACVRKRRVRPWEGLAHSCFCGSGRCDVFLFVKRVIVIIWFSVFYFGGLGLTLRICLVADCERFNCQTIMGLSG